MRFAPRYPPRQLLKRDRMPLRMTRNAFPDDGDSQPGTQQSGDHTTVAPSISFELLAPAGALARVPAGERRIGTPRVPVPEAAVHENRRVVPRQEKVRPARKPPPVKTVAKAGRMKKSPNRQFRPGVLRPDARHQAAALAGRKTVCHDQFIDWRMWRSSRSCSLLEAEQTVRIRR